MNQISPLFQSNRYEELLANQEIILLSPINSEVQKLEIDFAKGITSTNSLKQLAEQIAVFIDKKCKSIDKYETIIPIDSIYDRLVYKVLEILIDRSILPDRLFQLSNSWENSAINSYWQNKEVSPKEGVIFLNDVISFNDVTKLEQMISTFQENVKVPINGIVSMLEEVKNKDANITKSIKSIPHYSMASVFYDRDSENYQITSFMNATYNLGVEILKEKSKIISTTSGDTNISQTQLSNVPRIKTTYKAEDIEEFIHIPKITNSTQIKDPFGRK